MIERNRFPEALKILNDILDDPDANSNDKFGGVLRDVTIQKSIVLMHLGRYSDAASDLETMSASEPDGEVYFYLARCYYEIGRFADAKQAFERGIECKVPQESETEFHYFCGRNYWELGDYASARRHFVISAQSNSSHPPQSPAQAMSTATSGSLAGLEDPRKYSAIGGF